MRRSLVAFLSVLALLIPSASLAADDIADQVDPSQTMSDLLDGLVEISENDVPPEFAERVGEGGKLFGAPEGFSLDFDACVKEYGVCEAIAVVTEREEYLTDDEGNRIDVAYAWILDALGLVPGIYAYGSSSSYRWDFTDTMEYAAVVGSNVVDVGSVRATHKITLSGRQSTWKQSSDAWTGPSIKATNHWDCVDDNGIWPNTSCTGGWQRQENSVYEYGVHWSQDQVNHQDVDEYWYDFRESWKATGWSGWTWGLGSRSSHKFDCPSGGASCEF